jgi:hypothetical protein
MKRVRRLRGLGPQPDAAASRLTTLRINLQHTMEDTS